MTPEDTSGAGRPVLHAYGRRYLARMGQCSANVVARAAMSVDFGDPVRAVLWMLERRGEPELAALVRAALCAELADSK